MAGVSIRIEGSEIFNHVRAERIEMNIPDQFEQVWFFLAEDRFVAVLKKVVEPLVTLVERDGIAGEQPSHGPGQGRDASPDQEVDVVSMEGEGVTADALFGKYHPGTLTKAVPVNAVVENGAPCNPSNHEMVHTAPGASMRACRGMGRWYQREISDVNMSIEFNNFNGRPSPIPGWGRSAEA